MKQRNKKPVVVHMDVRKLKREPDTNLPPFSKVKLEKLIEEAVVDAYGEEEQVGTFLTIMEEHLALPFSTNIFGADVVVERVDMTRDGQIVAICVATKRGKKSESSTYRCRHQRLAVRNGSQHTAAGAGDAD
jgi:hypothetical protein